MSDMSRIMRDESRIMSGMSRIMNDMSRNMGDESRIMSGMSRIMNDMSRNMGGIPVANVTPADAIHSKALKPRPGFMITPKWVMVVATLLLITGCSGCEQDDQNDQVSQPKKPDQTRIYGTITVDEALDDSGDYSGIGVLVLDITAGPDTLFQSETDREGQFDGIATFFDQGAYELQIHRNSRRIADTTLILAHQDTVKIQGVLPRFSGHARISSRESEAMRTLNRLERQYNRILKITVLGGIAQDTIPYVLDNWSNIFWEVYKNWPETVAAGIAARESLSMLEERNDDLLMMRLRQYGENEDIRLLASRFGFLSELRQGGLDNAIDWMDSLESHARSTETRLQIAKNRIIALYDSSRIADARLRVQDYEAHFGDDEEAMQWLSAVRFDIEHLSPGEKLPPFHLEIFRLAGTEETNAGKLTMEDVLGSPAVIEVVSLSDRLYQSSYPQLQTVHMLFRQEGVRFLTIPVEENPVAVRAFYNERGQDWPVASAGAYAESDLEQRWNVYEMPVRFLIDSDGRIIRKFHGHNMNELLIEINRILNNGEIS